MPANMAAALAGRAPVLLRHGRLSRALPARAFTTASLRTPGRLSVLPSLASVQPRPTKRLGTVSIVRAYSSPPAQSGPNPKAYLESGVIKPKQKVDVKKVLVIGSGGLAIGQAGEFDYSGMSMLAPLPTPCRCPSPACAPAPRPA